MRVAIRADASSTIGSGHVIRCKTLADELRRRGAEIRFVCREHRGHLIPLLDRAGYQVATLPPIEVEPLIDAEETIDVLDRFAPDWVIVDHYGLDERWESCLGRCGSRLLVIDDLANRRHACQVLLDQNWFGAQTSRRYHGLVPPECECLLGPQYALLQPAFERLRSSLRPRDGSIRRVLVFFGAVDSAHQTVTALDALRNPAFADLAVDVVVGYANPRAPEVDVLVAALRGGTVHRDLEDLAGLMAEADLMLCAGGSTTWERCCLGLPAVVVIAAPNQEGFTTALAGSGAHWLLGDASRVTEAEWINALRELSGSPARVKGYSDAAGRLTDGRGVHRVAPILTQPRMGLEHVRQQD